MFDEPLPSNSFTRENACTPRILPVDSLLLNNRAISEALRCHGSGKRSTMLDNEDTAKATINL